MTDVQQAVVQDPVANAISNALLAKQQVEAIDDQLDLADSTGEQARKNSVTRGLITEYGEQMKTLEDEFVSSFTSSFSGNDELFVAAVTHLKNVINDKFGSKVNEVLAEKIKDMPVQEMSEADRKELEAKRQDFVKLYKYSKEIIEMLDKSKSRLPEELKSDLKIRRAGGSRGPTINGTYRFFVETAVDSGSFDEKKITIKGEEKPGGLSLIANQVCGKLNDGKGWQTRDLKEYILKELDLEKSVTGVTSTSPGNVNLPREWEVKLPDPVNLRIRGVRVAETTAPDEEDEPQQDQNTATEADLQA